jgi:hypothetical protein
VSKLSIVLVLALSLSFTACKKKYTQADLDAARAAGYSTGNAAGVATGTAAGLATGQANAVKAAALISSLYGVVGVGAGFDFELVKFGKDNANVAVIKYNFDGQSMVFAVDVSNYTYGTEVTSYLTTNPTYVNLMDNGDGTYSCNVGTCFSFSGIHPVTNMVFEKTIATSKDLDKAAAFVESYQSERLAANIASEFGLSEERSTKIAKLAATWEKLAKVRGLTNEDADAFAQELAGVNFAQINQAVSSMNQGSTTDMGALVAKAAEVNGTSSENMSAIMMKLFF